MTVLVLSATGTTGRATVPALLARGAQVRAATRTPTTTHFEENVEVVRFDPLDPSTWGSALRGVHSLYFCLPTPLADEVEQSLALVEAAQAHGVERIVMLSAFRTETVSYAPHKKIEAAIEASTMRWIHLRPNFFSDNFLQYLTPDNVITLPASTGRTSFVAASDIGEAAAVALLSEQHGETWTLTGPQALDHQQVTSILGQVLGRKVQYNDIPADLFATMLTQYMGVPPQKAAAMSMVYGVDVAQDKYAPIFEDLPRVLGRPATSFLQWAETNASAFAS